MKISFFNISLSEQTTLDKLLHGFSLAFHEEKLTKENVHLAKASEVVCVSINSEVRKDIINLLPKLKLIATRSTGFDHIDVAYAKKKGIKVVNVPSYGSRTVAEFTFALILNLSRKIFNARHQILEGGDFNIHNLQGFDLYGKILGVIGTGKIGKNVIRIARAFGMKVIACDKYPDKVFAKEQTFKYVNLNELLKNSDVITLHAPYNKANHHLINKKNIKLIRQGAYLINTARGELIETEALVKALLSGHLAGVGLDVLEDERQLREETEMLTHKPEEMHDFKTLFEDHILMDNPNAILTPHIAFFTREAIHEILQTTADNIKAFKAGKPVNLVK